MRNRGRNNRFVFAAAGVLTIVALGVGQSIVDDVAVAEAQGKQAPMFEVDPFWPRPLPNHWLLGSAIGVEVDERDHVWIVHRGTVETLGANEIPASLDPPRAEACCVPAPPVLEFDPEGNIVGSWGGPGNGYTWPSSNHGITLDHLDNVWIGGNGQGDSHVLKFTRDGQFLLEVGDPGMGVDSNSETHYSRVAKISIDSDANEAYFADGYGNRRVAVVDMTTGDLKRFWGAYGNQPDDGELGRYNPDATPAQQFRSPVHCAEVSNSGLIYVCDRQGDRIQVFEKDGTFVDEVFIAKTTLGSGTVWDLDFSPDENQRYLYVADGVNEKVYIVERESLELLTSFGDGGRQAGAFYGVHSIATDSAGNIYTTETYEGKRLQKFVYKGMGPVTARDQGVVWPVQ
jgi:DNA-binding beta-propeller fold protein YncE